MCFVTTYVSLVFVFFKQKTAYEMRISDWSSDVCSSDLSTAHARLLRGSVEGTVPLAPKKGTSTCRTSSSSPAMSAPRRKPAPPSAAPRSPTSASRLRGPSEAATEKPSRRPGEHTSQRPYLMRDSHAVFVLAQKNCMLD